MAQRSKSKAGFSLVEMLASLMLLGMGLLALFNCFARTVFLDSAAAEQADAVRIAQAQMETVKAMRFEDVGAGSEQFERNGLLYTCRVSVSARQKDSSLKDVTVTVSWMPQHSPGGTARQVRFDTAILRR
ncbi:MAG: prepilin-type N-terminal cleavage/methylation domain-containing protein [Bacillota bacterium]